MESEVVDVIQDNEVGSLKNGIKAFIYAVCCFFAAFLFISAVPIRTSPLGFFVLTAAFYLITLVFGLALGGKLRAASVLLFIFGLVIAFYRVMHGAAFSDTFPVFILSGFTFSLFVLSLFDNHSKAIDGRIVLDLVKSVCYLFISFASFFVALFKPEGTKRSGRTFLLTVAGLSIALVVVAIVISLLSFDSHFSNMMPKINLQNAGIFVLKLFLAVPVAALIYSVFSSSRQKKLRNLSTKETSDRISNGMHKMPTLIIVIPIIAVLVVYVLFFISQWAYYMSAFTHTLPEGYSASEYAREGFFQLCGVVGVNIILIAVLSCFNKRANEVNQGAERIMKILLSVASLVLIATAVSKMFLYIDLYDLTRDRLAVTIFLAFLAVAFLAIIISSIFRKIKALPIIIVSGIIFLCAFSLFNTDRFIASYNVDMYLGGKHENIDVAYINDDLGYSGVPELKRLYESATDDAVKSKAKEYLDSAALKMKDDQTAWPGYSLPYLEAKKSLDGMN